MPRDTSYKLCSKEEQRRVDDFFTRLHELFREYDVELTGCGCCGSPSLSVGETYQQDHYQFPEE